MKRNILFFSQSNSMLSMVMGLTTAPPDSPASHHIGLSPK